MSIWTMDIPTNVFTRIVNDFSEDLKKEYGMKKVTANGNTTWRNFSTSQVSETPPIFPYITVIKIAENERGQTFDRGINAAFFAFQIDVFDNKNQDRADKCCYEVVDIMSKMGFDAEQMPIPNSTSQEYRSTARCSLLIGFNDPL